MPDPIDIFTRKTFANDVPEPEADPEIVEILEQALNDAKTGRLTSFVFIGMTDDSIATGWSSSAYDDPFRYMGVLESIKTRFNHYLLNIEDDDE